MGVAASEVGYTSAMPRREDHEVRNGHVGHRIKKKKYANLKIFLTEESRTYTAELRNPNSKVRSVR